MATTAIVMPRLGMTMEEGTVVEWPIALGDPVEKGQTVLVIESEKSAIDIESTASGVLRHIYVEPEEVVPCATLLAAITEAADEPFDADTFLAEHQAANEAPQPAARASKGLPAASASRPRPHKRPEGSRQPVAPAARALARKLGLDLENIPGSGPGGRVTRRDVETFVESRERRVTVADGVELEVLREGEGAPVLLLPGFGTDISSFSHQSRLLSETHEVIGVNPRGVGLSDAPDLASYAVEQTAADAAAVLSQPAHVIGASLGAAAALELALSHPDRVRSLILVTPFVEASPRLLAVARAWHGLAAEATSESLALALAPWLFSEDLLENDVAMKRTLRGLAASVARVPAATLARAAAGMATWSGTRCADLGSLATPTLVVAAGRDLLTPDAERLAGLIPEARLALAPRAGHAVAIEAADQVSEAIAAHLARN